MFREALFIEWRSLLADHLAGETVDDMLQKQMMLCRLGETDVGATCLKGRTSQLPRTQRRVHQCLEAVPGASTLHSMCVVPSGQMAAGGDHLAAI